MKRKWFSSELLAAFLHLPDPENKTPKDIFDWYKKMEPEFDTNMFTRCINCGKSDGLTKEKKKYICNSCKFIHTVNSAKAVARLTEEEWKKYSQERIKGYYKM